jgi:hypothetical protein
VDDQTHPSLVRHALIDGRRAEDNTGYFASA